MSYSAAPNEPFDAVMFDFSGTLFRFEEDDSWLTGLTDELGRPFDVHQLTEIMRRMTAPVGQMVELDDEHLYAWTNRDLDPALHRRAYMEVLRKSGVTREEQAASLYGRVIDPACWTPYPDAADMLIGLNKRGVKIAVLSNIAFDIRPAFAALDVDGLVDEFVLSFEVGAVKPHPKIFEHALSALEVEPRRALMVGDSEEADGGAHALGCEFALVDPHPTKERVDGLAAALTSFGLGPVSR
ncbi:HAD family hydrolase [Hoyosella altamirensis]|uniref:HAD superfamily hydrolase (TIGR01509 family) n=1 Tax=Hoyosella altamirensis TaxID=616997 RepID=A0A839RKN8_9ACTN|nr:HAD-IA family hydrolase [Hoyosella altamirensis]MBB3036869.1 HAD superfamily hydrolase (TIGR01509 family) [Hoyosella altamirensis]